MIGLKKNRQLKKTFKWETEKVMELMRLKFDLE